MASLDSHSDRAANYIGSANLVNQASDQPDPHVAAQLARAEALLAVADSLDRVAAAVLRVAVLPVGA
jgi:hypothetical protein